MQIYAKLNTNKSIQAFSTEPQKDYKQFTIDAADAHFLAEYFNLMWADDNGLIHAENLPVTAYERKLAKQEAAINQASANADKKLAAMEQKIKDANDAYEKITAANSELDTKLENINAAVLEVTQAMATMETKGE